jgi:glycine cleavage system transcriptional repressor
MTGRPDAQAFGPALGPSLGFSSPPDISGPPLPGGYFQRSAKMARLLVTIVGRDRPGIVYLVSKALSESRLNLTDLNQTTLLGQFAGLFSATAPQGLEIGQLEAKLEKGLEGTGLSYWVTAIGEDGRGMDPGPFEPYVITLSGPNSPDLIPEVTKTVASFQVNIDNLRAVTISGEGGMEAGAVLVLEISVPAGVKGHIFRQALSLAAEGLGVEASLQHRDIFEAIHRV